MEDKPGTLVVSLDFELLWGMRDKHSVADRGPGVLGVRQVIPRLLEAFQEHGVKATFAAVGLLFFDDKATMATHLPELRPKYKDKQLSPYEGHLDLVGPDEVTDPYHFGLSLLRAIQKHPQHEIACHTFSHYYCLEPGQTEEEFAADLDAAIMAATPHGITLRSLVFPRNQFNSTYLGICLKKGMVCYRGNESGWLHAPRNSGQERLFRRACRLADAWINLSSHHCHLLAAPRNGSPVNIPASRFLRPWNRWTAALEPLRARRITRAMDHAAKTGRVFHLWWHPHNFGMELERNMAFLQRILGHFDKLRREQAMRSLTMHELANEIALRSH